MKQSIFRLILTIILGTIILPSCNKNKETAKKKNIIEVSTTKATNGIVDNEETFSTIIMPWTTNNIVSQSGGRLEALYVQIGDKVRKGQTLATMDQSQLNQIKVRLENAKTDYNRADELYKVGGISRSQWEQASIQVDILSEQYNNLRNNTILKSPTNGVVTARNYDVGDMTSFQLPILVVEDISEVKMVLKISEKYYSQLKNNMIVNISTDAVPDKIFEGHVYNIYPTIDANTHSVTIEVKIDNKNTDLRPGMYAKATINFGEEESILVPDVAVMTQLGSGQKIVYLLKEGKAIARTVEVGRIVGDKYQILSGLNVGDKIITSRVNTLFSGMEVKEVTINEEKGE